MKYAPLGLAAIAAAILAFTAQPNRASAPTHLTVVELFQSEGCSSCPPAEAILNQIANNPQVLALSFEVTYWNQLGWADGYSKEAFTDRQRNYARALGVNQLFTPQMVIDGRQSIIGAQPAQVEAALHQHRVDAYAPTITSSGGQVSITGGVAPRDAKVWLVSYDPRTINVPIRSGENAGRTLPHRNIVLGLNIVGGWTGGAQHFALPAPRANVAHAVLIQSGTGGAIIAAAKAG